MALREFSEVMISRLGSRSWAFGIGHSQITLQYPLDLPQLLAWGSPPTIGATVRFLSDTALFATSLKRSIITFNGVCAGLNPVLDPDPLHATELARIVGDDD